VTVGCRWERFMQYEKVEVLDVEVVGYVRRRQNPFF
jgi:hypothetical protein